MAAQQIAILTANAAYADEEEKYKVWPTNDDRAAFSEIMDAASAAVVPLKGTLMVGAYQFFRASIQEWLGGGTQVGGRAKALSGALQTHIRLIVLDLDNSDEPQAIFETLNAHGTPLLPADLIKNWLLWEASRQHLKNMGWLYQTYWREFDRDAEFWRSTVGTGHAARARVDTFLQNWLTRRTRREIAAKHLYQQFLGEFVPRGIDRSQSPCDVPALMADICQDGARYRELEQPAAWTRFHIFLRRLPAIGIVVFHPVLLALMGRQGSDHSDLDACAIVLESYLVRRIVCWEQTRAYNDVMLTLLNAIATLEPEKPAAPAIAYALTERVADTYRWPNDEVFRHAWISSKFYGGYRRSRVLMILQALEEYYQREGAKSEPLVSFDFSSLEIEHILPQEWENHWPLPSGATAEADRERRLHGIGNLTLVTRKLNPTLSNAAWLDGTHGHKGKRSALDSHSKLQLNARLVKGWPDQWNEASIDDRAAKLFEAARQIWPSPPVSSPT